MIRNAGTRFFVASALRHARSAASILPMRGETSGAFFFDRGLDLAEVLDLAGVLNLARGFAAERERGPFF